MITPEDYAKSGTEHAHQTALFCWCALSVGKYPELELLFHIPNGGTRNKIEAARLKAAGVKAGVPDLCLPVARSGFNGLFLEMKKPGEKIKPGSNQDLWAIKLREQGYAVKCCDNWVDAKDWILTYLHDKEFYVEENKMKEPNAGMIGPLGLNWKNI